MKSKLLFAFMAAALCALAQSCGSDDDDESLSPEGGTGNSTVNPSDTPSSDGGGSGFSYDASSDDIANSSFSKTITIEFDADAATVSGEADGVVVSTDGAYVSVVSQAAEVEYVLRGETGDGALKVYSDKKYKLTLDGVKLTSRRGSAINNQGKKRLFVFLAEGTTSSLTDASSYVATPSDEDEKATLFSEGQVVFCGSGALEVTGNHKHAICSDDYVVVADGAKVSVLASKKDGIHTNDHVAIVGGVTSIATSGDDGIDAGGYFVMTGGSLSASVSAEAAKAIKAAGNVYVQGGSLRLTNDGEPEYDADEDDYKAAAGLASDSSIFVEGGEVVVSCSGVGAKGLKADGGISVCDGSLTVVCSGASDDYVSSKGVKADGDINISGGQISVTSASHEGIESKSKMNISGGVIEVEAYDDAINSGGDMRISGGRIYARGKTNDGLDANGNLIIEGGLVVAYGTSAPECGLDANEEEGFRLYVTGGTVLGVGGGTSYPASTTGSQAAVAISAALGNVALKDSDGNVVLAWECDDASGVSVGRQGDPGGMGGGGRPGGMGGGWTYFVSTPGMVSGGTYTLHSGVAISASDAFHGLSTSGVDVLGGTSAGSATASVTAGGR